MPGVRVVFRSLGTGTLGNGPFIRVGSVQGHGLLFGRCVPELSGPRGRSAPVAVTPVVRKKTTSPGSETLRSCPKGSLRPHQGPGAGRHPAWVVPETLANRHAHVMVRWVERQSPNGSKRALFAIGNSSLGVEDSIVLGQVGSVLVAHIDRRNAEMERRHFDVVEAGLSQPVTKCLAVFEGFYCPI